MGLRNCFDMGLAAQLGRECNVDFVIDPRSPAAAN